MTDTSVPRLQLPSRYVLWSWRRFPGNVALALVELPENKATPFATYRVDPETGDCFWGDYLNTSDHREAHTAFLRRAYGDHASLETVRG